MLYPARVFSEPIRDIVALPTITIYANPPKGDPYWGLGGNSNGPVMPPPGAPPGNIGTIGMETVANGEKFFAAANEKDPISVEMHSFKDLAAVQLPTSIHSSDTSDCLHNGWQPEATSKLSVQINLGSRQHKQPIHLQFLACTRPNKNSFCLSRIFAFTVVH
ncbi:hypothetical protein [Burkholderia gladioli]|uniref:hypothetical protein n=1 Tax=Burkholderia gladioli TaxID=28095 RepID=UPI001640E9D1|nr:hypothetical protein [Burkholderia gladioli]